MAKELEVYLSGGASNNDPNLSLGGVISTNILYGQSVSINSGSSPIPGLTFLGSENLGVNVHITTRIETPDFGGFGIMLGNWNAGVGIYYTLTPTDGEYLLVDGDTSVTVSVVTAQMVYGGGYIDGVSIQNNLLDEVTSNESKVGDVTYRHFYLKNSTVIDKSIKVYIGAQLSGQDYIEIGFANTVSGADDELLVSDKVAPTGVAFTAGNTVGDVPLLTVSALGKIGVYVKRTVLPLTSVSQEFDSGLLKVVEY